MSNYCSNDDVDDTEQEYDELKIQKGIYFV